jgi:hypothetical protein
MKGLRMCDNKNIGYPCVDVYRFRDCKIREWRVYPIGPTYVVYSAHRDCQTSSPRSEPGPGGSARSPNGLFGP